MMLIDTHTHLNFNAFEGEVKDLITKCFKKNIWVVNVGTKYETSEKAIEIAEKYDEGVYASVAIHPIYLSDDLKESDIIDGKDYSFTTKKQEFNIDKFRKLAKSSSKVVAIGETGIDLFHLENTTKEEALKVQSKVFEDAIDLAKELDLALIVHGRGEKDNPYEVYDIILDIIEEKNIKRGVLHCFGGTLEQVRRAVKLGFNVGITGIVTFKNAKQLQEIVKEIPLENLVIETDAPYLSPEPHRGKRNEPSYVEFVAKKIAEIKGIEYEKVAEETTVNARRMYVI